MDTSGLPGKRVDAYRAGIIAIAFNGIKQIQFLVFRFTDGYFRIDDKDRKNNQAPFTFQLMINKNQLSFVRKIFAQQVF